MVGGAACWMLCEWVAAAITALEPLPVTDSQDLQVALGALAAARTGSQRNDDYAEVFVGSAVSSEPVVNSTARLALRSGSR